VSQNADRESISRICIYRMNQRRSGISFLKIAPASEAMMSKRIWQNSMECSLCQSSIQRSSSVGSITWTPFYSVRLARVLLDNGHYITDLRYDGDQRYKIIMNPVVLRAHSQTRLYANRKDEWLSRDLTSTDKKGPICDIGRAVYVLTYIQSSSSRLLVSQYLNK
jgi:hypothetical protein